MADAFPIDEAQIVALFLESLFYGTYLVSFGMCMYSLVSRRRHTGKRWPLFVVALLLFTFATLDVALLVRHVLDAFVWYRGPGGARAEFADISYWVNVMKTVCYAAQTTIADGMLIYRCFIVYGRNWYITSALCVLWLACMVVEAFTCYIEFTLHQNAFLNADALTPFITSTLSLTLALNLIATLLIVGKIFTIQRRSEGIFISGGRGDALGRAMRIVIESGAMYSVAVVTFFVVYLSNNNAQYGVSDCVVQIIGIAFNLIIIRVDQNKTLDSAAAAASSSGSRTRAGVVSLHFARGGSSSAGTAYTDSSNAAFGMKMPDGTSADGKVHVEVVPCVNVHEEEEEDEERALGWRDAALTV